jgi:cell surface protein SprA
LSTTGIDFSRIRFVEIWVNDFDADHDSTNVLLHMSLGRVSEDAFWSKTDPPNRLLDTEDKNDDGKLDGGDPLSDTFEDTGFDGVVSQREPLYNAATNPDPSGDDYRYNVRDNPDDYSTINNLEFNGIGEANARPDTEDLNRDTFLDEGNNYFETTIDLAAMEYVAIDVPRDYAGHTNVKPNNGWRLFRVPVTGTTFRSVGSPSWQNIQHCRLWVSDATRPLKIQIGGIEFVGSRWLEAAITNPDMIARDVQLDIRTRNNKDVGVRAAFGVPRFNSSVSGGELDVALG